LCMTNSVTVIIQPYGKRISVPKETNLLEAIREAGVIIRSVCGGQGECGKCKVIIEKGDVQTSYGKNDLLTQAEIDKGYVIACLSRCLSDCYVYIPPETRIEGQKIQIDVKLPHIKPNPIIKKVFIPMKSVEKDLQHYISNYFDGEIEFPQHILNKLRILRGLHREGVTAIIRSDNNIYKLIDLEGGDTSRQKFGLAIDIGTTKIVVFLVDLNSGAIIDSLSEYNAQLAYGEDLVSRISYAMEYKGGLKVLQKSVVESINRLIRQMINKHGLRTSEIYDVCVAGNTVMTYLFIGEDPSPLLETKIKVEIPRNPFIIDVGDIGLDVNPHARIYCLPAAGRFLGGDTIGDILVSGIHKSPDISLLIDIGTNVEVVLGGEGWLLATTAAAGPAFEGWGVRFGMRGITGAIESVTIDANTLKANYKVIGNAKPKGICGSGLIDLVSEMFRKGIIDTLGKINRKLDSPYIREGQDGYEYIVVPKEESGVGMDIVITEKDIANLIDSKSAACAAVAVLMKKMKLSVGDISKVFICGAFGNYINPNNAMAIGLIPEFSNAEIVYLGNGSVGGAYLTLVSKNYREQAIEVAELIAYYDLLKDADFMDEYLAGFVLPGKKELFPVWWDISRKKAL